METRLEYEIAYNFAINQQIITKFVTYACKCVFNPTKTFNTFSKDHMTYSMKARLYPYTRLPEH